MKKHPVNQEALFSSLFPKSFSRAEKRQLQILQAAIECFATLGIENTSYEAIGKKCGTSRALVQHYFPDKDEFLRLVVLYVRAEMQNLAVQMIQNARTAESRLTQYIQFHFDFILQKPTYWTVWMLLFYYCGFNPSLKSLHTELTTTSHERLIAMLNAFKANQDCTEKDIRYRAKTLQALITGALVEVHTENFLLPRDTFVSQIISDCLKIAKNSR